MRKVKFLAVSIREYWRSGPGHWVRTVKISVVRTNGTKFRNIVRGSFLEASQMVNDALKEGGFEPINLYGPELLHLDCVEVMRAKDLHKGTYDSWEEIL